MNTAGPDPQTLGNAFDVFYIFPFTGDWSIANLMRVHVTLAPK
jgi:hypothetical protein